MSKNVTINDKAPWASVGGNEYNNFGNREMKIDVALA